MLLPVGNFDSGYMMLFFQLFYKVKLRMYKIFATPLVFFSFVVNMQWWEQHFTENIY